MKPYVRAVTIQNLDDLPFDAVLEGLEDHLLEEIPEGTMDGNPEAMNEIDRLIGRFANLYAYIAYLYAYAAGRAQFYKAAGLTDQWHEMVRKKDALYEFRGAIKLKWQACSRMVTVNIAEEEEPADGVNYEKRGERISAAKGKGKVGWGHVS